jgi:nucleolar protein 12
MQGRARKMLGRAGAAHVRKDGVMGSSVKAPESFVFEGHRASRGQSLAGFKLGGSGKKKGKPKNRSTKRAAAWQASGGSKPTKEHS